MSEILIGAVPSEEDCAQLGQTPDFERLNRLEIACYQAGIIALHGPPPAGAAFRVAAHHHDFGTYRELALRYQDQDGEASRYAELVEDGFRRWVEVAMPSPVEYPTARTPIVHTPDIDTFLREMAVILERPFRDNARRLSNLRAFYPLLAEPA